jgi:hypothetical protein
MLTIRCTVGEIRRCANLKYIVGAKHRSVICTVHCLCHTMLCHLYCSILNTAVQSVCTAELFYCCQCAVFLQHIIQCSELSCLSVRNVLLSADLFHSIPNFFKPPTKFDTIPHNVLLSKMARFYCTVGHSALFIAK